MFSTPRISWSHLSIMLRSMSTMLHSGVALTKTLDVVARQAKTPRAARVFTDIQKSIRKGETLTRAMLEHAPYFPELVTDMVNVADQTGALPEVLVALADHYENLVRLRKTFISAITPSILQFLAAVFIIAGLIAILGWIAEGKGAMAIDPLGLGLLGTSGALIWLGMIFGSIFSLWMIYQLIAKGFGQARSIHQLALNVWVLGDCLRSFAIARFSWAFSLTQQAGMPIEPSIDASMKATNNAAFQDAASLVKSAVIQGEDLTTALEACGLFPHDFLEMVHVGETSGLVPETLARLSPQLEDRAKRSLIMMTTLVAWLIWLLVAAFIIVFIFQVALFYIAQINDAMKGI